MSTATAQKPATIELEPPPAASSWASTCLNCGSALGGPFCAECGQRAVPPHPTLRELFGEAFAEFSGWDGKFSETLRALVLRPGQLTLEFLAGRRHRYISPLRLYLTCSLVYFLLAQAAPLNDRDAYVGLRTPVAQTTTGSATPAAVTDEDRQEILKSINAAPAVFRPLIRRVATDPARLQQDVFTAMPKALFALLPVFALILMLFYRRHRFTDHLYFAIHVHAFVFVALIANELVKYVHAPIITGAFAILILLWIPAYGHLALRRAYGGSQGSTFVKELGIGALYAAASVPVIVLLALWVASRTVGTG